MDLTTFFMFLMLLEGEGGGAAPGPGPSPGPGPMPVPPTPGPAPGPIPHVQPIKPGPAPAPAKPSPPVPLHLLNIKPAPFPTPVKPQGLPPFPGPQWTPCPTTAAIVARAQYWNPILWNYAAKSIRQATAQEQLGGQWITFKAANHGTSSGIIMATEAYCLQGTGPTPPPPGPLNTVQAVGPEPELGGWQSDVAFIKRYQAALSYLSFTKNQAAWNTQGVDGSAGPHTMAAVKAFQSANGLSVDGEVGSATASAIDRMLGYPVPAGGYPPPSSGGGGGGGGGLPAVNPSGNGGGNYAG